MESKKISALLSSFFYRVLFIFVGASFLHLAVRIITLASFQSEQELDITKLELFKIYSFDMIPNLFAYAILLMIVYNLFIKTKRAIEKENESQIAMEKEKVAIMSSQALTSLMVEAISSSNNDIKEWLRRRKQAGTAPKEVEEANENISNILKAFSESMFLAPYIQKPNSGEERIKELKMKIKEIMKREQTPSSPHEPASEKRK